MKRHLVLLVFLLVFNVFVDAKTQTNVVGKKAPVCLTIQAENGSIKQKVNEDGTITCIFKTVDVIRVSSIVINGVDITNQIDYNVVTLPLLTENATLEITFDSPETFTQPVYNTIVMF